MLEGRKKYFIKVGHSFFLRDKCIDLIFALATNYTVKATTIVKLSLSRFLKKQYSRLFQAIGRCFSSKQNKEGRTEERIKIGDRIKKFLFESAIKGGNGIHSFAINVTSKYTKTFL